MKNIIFIFVFASLFWACKRGNLSSEKGIVSFINNIDSEYLKSNSNSFDEVTHAVVSITKDDGTEFYNSKKIELFKINGNILTYPEELLEGSYLLTEFYLVDATNNILFIAPKEGSNYETYVNDPLSIAFTIYSDQETKTTVEILSTETGTIEDFGYMEFDANLIETFDILVSAFKYNTTNNTFELTDGILTVSAGSFIINDTLEAANNIVRIKDGIDSYQVKFTKDGSIVYNNTFTSEELKAYKIEHINPLKIYIDNSQTQTITLQPGAEGKDAFIADQASLGYNDKNWGNIDEFTAIAWTNQGNVLVRSLFDFDLTALPANVKIIDATLTLYAINNTINSSNTGGHSQLSGSNECVLQRITKAWEESEVTWNNQPTISTEDQITLPASESAMQNYAIDIASYVQEKINNPSTTYGFMLKLVTEEYYRKLIFASSDYENASMRPKLEIKYVN